MFCERYSGSPIRTSQLCRHSTSFFLILLMPPQKSIAAYLHCSVTPSFLQTAAWWSPNTAAPSTCPSNLGDCNAIVCCVRVMPASVFIVLSFHSERQFLAARKPLAWCAHLLVFGYYWLHPRQKANRDIIRIHVETLSSQSLRPAWPDRDVRLSRASFRVSRAKARHRLG